MCRFGRGREERWCKKEKDKNCEVVVKRPWVLTVGHVPAVAPAVCDPVLFLWLRLF